MIVHEPLSTTSPKFLWITYLTIVKTAIIRANYYDLTATSLELNKGNHPKKALFEVSE